MTYAADLSLGPVDASLGRGTILFGGSGFLGPYILENYPDVISVGRNPPPNRNRHIPITSLEDLDALKEVEFENVIYIIGNTDHHNLEKPVVPRGEPTAYDYHSIPILRVLEQLKERPIKKFMHFSTILIYDEEKITLPVSERSPIDPYKNRYVFSKYLGEQACEYYRRWMPIINVRLSNIYGPTPLGRFDLIHRLSHQLLDTGRGEVWSTRPQRDFIYIEDVAHAIMKLLRAEYSGNLILGTGTMSSVAEVVEILRDASGCPIDVLDQEVAGPMRFRCDRTTIDRLIDWEPRYDLDRGVRKTFELTRSWKEAG